MIVNIYSTHFLIVLKTRYYNIADTYKYRSIPFDSFSTISFINFPSCTVVLSLLPQSLLIFFPLFFIYVFSAFFYLPSLSLYLNRFLLIPFHNFIFSHSFFDFAILFPLLWYSIKKYFPSSITSSSHYFVSSFSVCCRQILLTSSSIFFNLPSSIVFSSPGWILDQ